MGGVNTKSIKTIDSNEYEMIQHIMGQPYFNGLSQINKEYGLLGDNLYFSKNRKTLLDIILWFQSKPISVCLSTCMYVYM